MEASVVDVTASCGRSRSHRIAKLNNKITFRAISRIALINVFIAVGLLSVSPAFSYAQDAPRPEIAKHVNAYAGYEGTRVWVLRIGPRENNTAIVQIGGVDHPFDMKIVLSHVEETAKDKRYSVENAGKKFVLLIVNDYGGELYLPETSKTVSLRYDDSLSQSSNAEHFLTEYLNQSE